MGRGDKRRALERYVGDVLMPFEGYEGDGMRAMVQYGEDAPMGVLLFEADDATHQGYGMEVGQRKLEGWVALIVGYEEDVVGVGSLAHSLDECSLVGVEHVGLVPLEEDVGEGHLLARHEVAR